MFKPIIDILKYIRIFQKYLGFRMYLIFLLSLVASIFEGIGILMLLPLLGGVFFLRRIFYLCDSFSILISVSCFLLLIYLGGLLGIIQSLVYVLTGFGLVLLLWEIHRIFKGKIINSVNFTFCI